MEPSPAVRRAAFQKYGINSLNLIVFEFYVYDWDLSTKENLLFLLAMEQRFLDLLNPRYNILPTAGSMLGHKWSEESKAAFSRIMTGKYLGENNPAYGRTGEKHPMYGTTAPNAQTVYIYSTEKVLVNSFSSQVDAANWLSTSRITVQRYIKSPLRGAPLGGGGKVFQARGAEYYVTNVPLNS
jgi:hypothetical protein